MIVTSPIPAAEQDILIDKLAGIADEPARRDFLRQRPEFHEPEVMERIYEKVVRLVLADLGQADRHAQDAAHARAITA